MFKPPLFFLLAQQDSLTLRTEDFHKVNLLLLGAQEGFFQATGFLSFSPPYNLVKVDESSQGKENDEKDSNFFHS